MLLLKTLKKHSVRRLSAVSVIGLLALSPVVIGDESAFASDPVCGPKVGAVHQVSTPAQLQAVGSGGAGAVDCGLGASYLQVNDITLASAWTPVSEDGFTGTFDGGNFSITGLEVDGVSTSKQGMFRYVTGTVTRVNLVEASITNNNGDSGTLVGYLGPEGVVSYSSASGSVSGPGNLGGLVGISRGSISHSSADVNVSGTDFSVGGLLGFNNGGTVSHSHATGAVTSAAPWGYRVGGLVGYSHAAGVTGGGAISASYATGAVTGVREVGGLVGLLRSAKVEQSYSSSAVVATGAVVDPSTIIGNAGGLVGAMDDDPEEVFFSVASVEYSYASGSVTSTGDFVGGLVGESNSSDVFASYSVGTVTGTGSVGGLVGLLNSALIEESYSSSVVVATGTAGGLVGWMKDDWGPGSTVKYSYASGSVTSTGDYVGGLAGLSRNSDVFASYASGAVVGNDYVGGLAGYFSGQIVQAYSVGSVQANAVTTDVGGFLGYDDGADLIANFWDVQTSGFSTSAGEAPDYLEGLSSQAMKTITPYAGVPDEEGEWGIVPASQFSAPLNNASPPPSPLAKPDGTPFEETWGIGPSVNSGYPFLWWQTSSGVEQIPTGDSLSTGGGFSAAPQTTITSSGTSLTVNLNKTRVLRVSGSNLNLVTEARVAGKRATINFAKSNSGILVISELPLLPSGKYTLTLLTPTGLVAAEVEVGIIAKITRLRGIAASGKLSTKVRSVVRKQNLTYASAGTLRCWGVTTSSSASELALAKQKAEAACAYAKTRMPELDVVASSRAGTGKPARNQAVKLRYLK